MGLWDTLRLAKRAYQDGFPVSQAFKKNQPQRAAEIQRAQNFLSGGLKLPILIPSMDATTWTHYDESSSSLRIFRNFPFINGFSVDNNNNSYAVKIMLDYSPNRVYLVPKLSMKTYTNLKFKSISIYAAGAITEGEVYLTLMRTSPEVVAIEGAR